MSEYTEYKERLSKYLKANQRYPRSIFMELTPYCNLKCVFCPCYIEGEEVTLDRRTKFMPLENFRRIIDGIHSKFNFQICFTYSGEPLLNSDVYRMVGYLSERGIPSVIHSNAMPLTPEKTAELLDSSLDRFIVSFDGATKETYEDVRRGADFGRVVENIRTLVSERNRAGLEKPFVEMQFVVTSRNFSEIPLFKSLCEDIGVDNSYTKTLCVYQDTQNAGYVEQVREYFVEDEVARYMVVGGGELVLKDMGPCPEIGNTVITVDGDVVICCFDVHGKHKFGNCIEEALDVLWDSPRYRKFREEIMNKRALPVCKTCNTSTHITKKV